MGPSDGCAEKFSGKGNILATGPSWQRADGSWVSLAELQPAEPVIEILEETETLAAVRITYDLGEAGGVDEAMTLIETITVKPGIVLVKDEVPGDIDKMRINWPMLVFDGQKDVSVDMTERAVTLGLDSRKMNFSVLKPSTIRLYRSGKKLNHRNGIVEAVLADFQGNSATYCIKAE